MAVRELEQLMDNPELTKEILKRWNKDIGITLKMTAINNNTIS